MKAEIVSVGTELLLGEIANTDAQYLSEALAALGIDCYYHTVVGDNPARLRGVLEAAGGRSELIITTGGLGPTYDDLTKEVLCETFGLKLALHEPSLERIKAFFAGRGKPMTENNVKQAYLPEGADVFTNDWGTAPGCAVKTADGHTLVMLPGPPREFHPMVEQRLVPYFKAKADGVTVSHTLRIFGEGESAIEYRLRPMMEKAANPSIAPYCKGGEVELRVTAKAANAAEADALTAPALEAIRAELGELVYGQDIGSLEEALVPALRSAGMKFACAESCTGGLIAKRITDVPGCSDVFLGGAVTYANSVKEGLLFVPGRILEKYGAVSRRTAVYMAANAAALTGADITVSTTGIAGPGGGTEEKPVGLVWVGVCLRGVTMARELHLGGMNRDRALIRHIAASNALSLALKAIKK